MNGIKFFTFPKPNLSDMYDPKSVQCREWISACNRPAEQLNLRKILEDHQKRSYYYKICSKVGLYEWLNVHFSIFHENTM